MLQHTKCMHHSAWLGGIGWTAQTAGQRPSRGQLSGRVPHRVVTGDTLPLFLLFFLPLPSPQTLSSLPPSVSCPVPLQVHPFVCTSSHPSRLPVSLQGKGWEQENIAALYRQHTGRVKSPCMMPTSIAFLRQWRVNWRSWTHMVLHDEPSTLLMAQWLSEKFTILGFLPKSLWQRNHQHNKILPFHSQVQKGHSSN